MRGIIGLKILNHSIIHLEQSPYTLSDFHFDKDKNIFIQNIGNSIFGTYQPANFEPKREKKQFFTDSMQKFSLIFDGEIFNYQELKNKLLKENIFFETNTDGEVLLYHLIKNGEKGISELRGSFAFAFYDIEKDVFLLVRDHFGIKPLVYSIQEDKVVFASELTALKPFIKENKINQSALNAYFRFTYIPAPETIVEGVKKMIPGHFLKITKNKIETVQYFSVRDSKISEISLEDAAEKIHEKLTDATLQRLDTREPMGSFLSGGVDSSIVSQIASTFKENLDTFSIGFKENNFFDESKYAQNVAEHIQANHHLIQLSKEEVISEFPTILSVFDEPYADSSVVALYFLIQEARGKASFCLAGDAADEIFAGYNKHKAYKRSKNPGIALKLAAKIATLLPGGNRRGKLSNRLRQLKKFHDLSLKKWPETYWNLAQFVSENRRKSILNNFVEYQPEITVEEDNLQNFLWMDQEFILPNDMLKKVDIMARYFDFEARSPFLDVDLVNLANSLPDEFRLKGNSGKRILREAFGSKLPEEVFTRAKRGFEIPLQDWINSSWNKIIVEKWFEKEYLDNQGLFSFLGIKNLKQDFSEAKEEEATIAMWQYIVFQNWFDRWEKK